VLRPALIDAHCHLGDAAFDVDRDAVLARADAAGVTHVVVIGSTLDDSETVAALAKSRPGLSATAGVHPHEAHTWSAEAEGRLRVLLAAPAVVAVGETGLDYHYEHSSRAAQRAAFDAQLALAAELGKPAVVHARDADDDVAAALAGTRATVVLHSFNGGPKLFEAGLAIGAYFSFSGMITFKNWAQAERLAACPADRLLVETDAPYLAPVPHRGRRNEPAFVREVALAMARVRGVEPDETARGTTANARRVFGAAVATPLEPTEAAP
jgi:TatD DNase family protein